MSIKMSEHELKGDKYMKSADNKNNVLTTMFASLLGNSSKLEEAIDLYTKAAISYKMAKQWKKAGNAYRCSASLHIRDNSRHNAANDYVNAANCYKKCGPNEAIDCLNKAIDIFTDTTRLTTAAKYHVMIAEIYEKEFLNVTKAMANYEIAANYFKCDESIASANKCLLNVAHYSASLGDYQKAIDIYEEVGAYCIDSSLLKYSAKDHYFRAALCHTCIDHLNGELAVKRYEELFPAFSDSRECKFVKKLLVNLEDADVDGFTQTVKDFDSISRLDKWFVNILLKIKQFEEKEMDMK